MKRLLAALLALCLLPACAFALDLSRYALPEIDDPYAFVSHLSPVSADAFYWLHSTTKNPQTGQNEQICHLQRYDRGALTLSLRLPAIPHASFSPLIRADGGAMVLMGIRLESSDVPWKEFYTVYDVSGQTLFNPRSLDGNPYMLRYLNGCFFGMADYEGGQSLLLLYDEQMNLARQFAVPMANVHIQALTRSGDALYLLLMPRNMGSYALVRVGDDGSTWAQQGTVTDYRFNALFPDGQGGVLLSGSLMEDYRQTRLRCVDASGAAVWEQTLCARNAIVQPLLAQENTDGSMTLFGRAVAKSRNLHALFAMTLDKSGDIRTISAWDFSDAKDTSIALLPAADGEMLAYSPGSDGHIACLLPLSALPSMNQPGLWLE